MHKFCRRELARDALSTPRLVPLIYIPSLRLKNRLQPPYVFPSGIFAPLRGDSPLTTIVSVRRHGKVVMAGDGQVSLGNTVMKGNAKKVRRLYHGQVIAGFAGATADAFTLFEIGRASCRERV